MPEHRPWFDHASPAGVVRYAVGMVEEYLESLPHGISSYPLVRSKMAGLNALVSGYEDEIAEAVPPEVRAILRNPPPLSSWVTEVEAQCALIALRQNVFRDDDAYVSHARIRGRRVMEGPLYRAVFRVFSSSRVARLTQSAWGLFHKGTTNKVIESHSTHIVVRMHHPRHIFLPFVMRGFLCAGEEALKIGGAKGVRSAVVSMEATSSLARLEWGS
ncbi:MAG: hypothetical protein AB8H86_10770 [Polyangiales bacterium]